MQAPKPPSGRDIWNAIREELTNHLYLLPFSTIAPTVYYAYLHPEDFAEIEGIVPRIVSELTRALTSEVQRMNRDASGRGGRFWNALRNAEQVAPIEISSAGWEIYIQPDQDGELLRGQLGVLWKLTMPAQPEYGGIPTTRVVRTVFEEGRRTKTVSDVQEAVSKAPTSPSATHSNAASLLPAASGHAWPDGVRATLTYSDDEGTHVFSMKKDSIKVGRGGADAWVDVQVMTNPRVSREHCWIHTDSTGRFFVQDVSTWGTWVNGERIPEAMRSAEGAAIQPGEGRELPSGAQIELAETLVIQFRAGSDE